MSASSFLETLKRFQEDSKEPSLIEKYAVLKAITMMKPEDDLTVERVRKLLASLVCKHRIW